MPKSVKKGGFQCIGGTIRTRQEIQCLPYVGFFNLIKSSSTLTHIYSRDSAVSDKEKHILNQRPNRPKTTVANSLFGLSFLVITYHYFNNRFITAVFPNPSRMEDLCIQCAFRTSEELEVHQIYYHGKKQFSCSHCERSFAKSGHLNTHIMIHTREGE